MTVRRHRNHHRLVATGQRRPSGQCDRAADPPATHRILNDGLLQASPAPKPPPSPPTMERRGKGAAYRQLPSPFDDDDHDDGEDTFNLTDDEERRRGRTLQDSEHHCRKQAFYERVNGYRLVS
ncbi:hypothetical protein ZHAS_00007020 [Anopheles sinensis]|uniref:Uncharacterized protein n=1 Tax=Anopheles sinensis TaxID=74873 RepID=A0A084VNM8_ANOSI|nr:hypothetical protein ZHAS_00007020 [Anopheles sinensis]